MLKLKKFLILAVFFLLPVGLVIAGDDSQEKKDGGVLAGQEAQSADTATESEDYEEMDILEEEEPLWEEKDSSSPTWGVGKGVLERKMKGKRQEESYHGKFREGYQGKHPFDRL